MSLHPERRAGRWQPVFDALLPYAQRPLAGLLTLISLTACTASHGRWQTHRDDYGASYFVKEVCRAQPVQQTGVVRVTVLEGLTREPMPGLPVLIMEVNTRARQENSTSDWGSLTLPLPEGQYAIHVTCVGFNAFQTKPLAVRAGCELRVQVLLGADY